MRLIPRFEMRETVVSYCETTRGQFFLLALFFLLLIPIVDQTGALQMTLLLSVATFAPRTRRLVMLMGALLALKQMGFANLQINSVGESAASDFDQEITRQVAFAIVVGTYLGFCAVAFYRPKSWLVRHPVFNQVVLVTVLYALTAGYAVSREVAADGWILLASFTQYFWVCAYWIRDSKKPVVLKKPVKVHPSWTVPFVNLVPWLPQSGGTPYFKGPNYLTSLEAKTSRELAIAQIKGVKLLAWTVLLLVFRSCYERFLIGTTPLWGVENFISLPSGLGLRSVGLIIVDFNAGRSAPLWMCWASVFNEAFWFVLNMAIKTHALVAVARMLGFAVPRNTYQPLYSATITEYWNRVFFYFKELLVDFFFYPTYLRLSKLKPPLRLFIATIAAAGFGNFLWHFMNELAMLKSFGLVGDLVNFQAYAIYCLILSVSLALSQLRHVGRPRPQANVWRCSIVFVYYALLGVIANPGASLPLGAYFRFYFMLFGIKIN